MDVSNFDSAFTQDDALLTPVEPEFLETVEQQQFKGFSFTNPNYTLPVWKLHDENDSQERFAQRKNVEPILHVQYRNVVLFNHIE